MELSKYSSWYLLREDKFIELDTEDKLAIDENMHMGDIFFECHTAQRGKNGYGRLLVMDLLHKFTSQPP